MPGEGAQKNGECNRRKSKTFNHLEGSGTTGVKGDLGLFRGMTFSSGESKKTDPLEKGAAEMTTRP